MAKTKRLIELIMTVNAKRKFTVQELADEFKVSKRTMLRDLQELGELGIPLYSEVGPHGGYRVLKNRMLPPIAFTENEAIALFFACQSLAYYGSLPFEAESDSALKKFFHYLPEDTRAKINRMKNRVLFWTPTREQKNPHLRQLLEAAMNRNILTVDYESSHGWTSREILPLGLYASNGYWYCPAYCYKRKEIRLFRSDRMQNVILKAEAVPENGLGKQTIHEFIRDQPDSENALAIQVELTQMGVRKYQTQARDENKITIHDDGAGTVRVQADERDLDFLADFYLGFGTSAKVVEPPALVDLIRNKIKAVLKHYE